MNIYEKLLIIQSKLKAPKGQKNSFGGYNFRSCEDIYQAVKPLLTETRTALNVSDLIENVDGRYYIMATAKLTNVDEPSESITNIAWAREAESKKGMDDSQVTGSASSYARKYALCGLFCIDGEKDADSWNAGDGQPKQPTRAKKDSKAEPEKETEPTPAKPEPKKESDIATTATLNYLKKMIVKYAYRDFGGQLLNVYGVQALEEMTPEQLAKAAKQAEAYNTVHMDEKEAKENE